MKKPIWEGVYESYEEALGSKKIFKEERWSRQIIATHKSYLNEQSKSLRPITPPRTSNLTAPVSLLLPKTVLDIGGSTGWGFENLIYTIPQLTIENYYILETPKVIRHLLECDLTFDPRVTFISDKNIPNVSFVYSNSAFQYMEDHHILKILEQANPDYLMVENLLAGDIDDFYSRQNYYDSIAVVKFRNFTSFTSMLKDRGYELVYMIPYQNLVLGKFQPPPMQNFPKSKRLPVTQSFLMRMTIHP